MIRRPPRSTPLYSSAASDVYKRQHHQLNTQFIAKLLFIRSVTVLIDEEDVRLHLTKLLLKVKKSGTLIYPCLFNTPQRVDHVQSLPLTVNGASTLQLVDSAVRPYANIQVAMPGRLLKERHMT